MSFNSGLSDAFSRLLGLVPAAALVGACASESTVLGARPTCTDGVRNGTETGVDCGGGLCGPCPVGQACHTSGDCETSIGLACINGLCALSRSCAEIKSRNPAASDGIYSVDLSAQGTPAPFPVYCDMTTAGGGWTRVAFEPAGAGGVQVQAGLVYLGVEVATPEAVANGTAAGLVGPRFAGTYHDLAITWGSDYARMVPVSTEIFTNEVDTAIPLAQFETSDATLASWVSSAGGAIFCRAARSTDIRPGDTSWAVKPRDSTGTGCGCDDPVWQDRGAFYGGVVNATLCTGWGGGWAGVKDVNDFKGAQTSAVDLALWIR
jgi:hypothetical protein